MRNLSLVIHSVIFQRHNLLLRNRLGSVYVKVRPILVKLVLLLLRLRLRQGVRLLNLNYVRCQYTHSAHSAHSALEPNFVQFLCIQIDFFNGLISPSHHPNMSILFHGFNFSFKPIHKIGGGCGVQRLGPLVIIGWVSKDGFLIV